ncbi:MAG: NADH-quinone oxidoreductase subunit NuoF [Candidatus Hydrogenedentes bacterium]|nr:NADH-quinone oxidoreductase subunit NuoF [Candidatus Hydrogenedentota bacterium]
MSNHSEQDCHCEACRASLSREEIQSWLSTPCEDDLPVALKSKVRFLRREHVERPTIFLGTGTCGLGAGAGKTLKAVRAWLAQQEVEADIVEVGCIGMCSAEPLMDVQLPGRTRVSFSKVTEKKAADILAAVFAETIPADAVLGQFPGKNVRPWENVPLLSEHPFFAPQTRFVLAQCGEMDPGSLDEYIAHGGYRALVTALRGMAPEAVCDAVEISGLRGRGGGGFPTGKKWKFARAAEGDQKYLICNADEGDPGAFMDRAVIEGAPHRLLEGMVLAAYAIGATKAYVYIRAEYPLAVKRLKAAIKQAMDAGLLGDNILGTDCSLKIVIKMGAGAFVCGEETALIHSVEGKRGMPRPRPPFPAVKGLFGKPTVINNVETLANIPPILCMGAEKYAAIGTKNSKGTKVFALSGKVARTGLVEVAMGTTVRRIIFDIGGGIANGREFKAVQMGGPSGGCIPSQHLDIEIDYDSLKTVGAIMGSGGMVVMDEDTCMVDVAKFFMDFIQRESCGKCIPCREGTRRMLEILQRITRGYRNETGVMALERFQGIMYMERLAKVIKDTSLCGLGQTAPNPVLSTLRWFRDEYEAHIYERRCPAGVCQELRTFRINQEKCIGCGVCAKRCPAEAIVGEPKQAHYILAEKCIGCGSCIAVCRTEAVELFAIEDDFAAATV